MQYEVAYRDSPAIFRVSEHGYHRPARPECLPVLRRVIALPLRARYGKHAHLLSMILTGIFAWASALAHMSPAGPAPMMSTSTLLSVISEDVQERRSVGRFPWLTRPHGWYMRERSHFQTALCRPPHTDVHISHHV